MGCDGGGMWGMSGDSGGVTVAAPRARWWGYMVMMAGCDDGMSRTAACCVSLIKTLGKTCLGYVSKESE